MFFSNISYLANRIWQILSVTSLLICSVPFFYICGMLCFKVENELPEKIERLVRCEASGYQKLLMKHVKDKMKSLNHAKVWRSDYDIFIIRL